MKIKTGSIVIALALVASACGGSGDSRTRNAVIERDVACFNTEQDKTDTMNAMLQRKAEFEGENQNKLTEQFNLVRARVDEVYARQLAHPEWETRLSGNLSDKGRQELQDLADDYSAILKEYDALRDAVWFTNISNGLAYYDAKYQRASETPVCEASNNAADETTSSTSEAAADSPANPTENSTDSPDNSSGSEDSPQVTNSATDDAGDPAPLVTCRKPVIVSPIWVRTVVNKETLFPVSDCNGYPTEIRVISDEVSTDDVRTAPVKGQGWVVRFATPGIYQVGVQFVNRTVPQSDGAVVIVEVLEQSTNDPCAGKSPEVELKLMGAKSIAEVMSNCDAVQFAMLRLYAMEGNSPTEVVLSNLTNVGKDRSPNPLFLSQGIKPAGSYRLLTYYVELNSSRMPAVVGTPTVTDFEITTSEPSDAQDDQPTVLIMPVNFFAPVDESGNDSGSNSDNSPSDLTGNVVGAANPSAIAVPASAETLTCNDACVADLVKKAGVSVADLSAIDFSVFVGTWMPLRANNDIPLTGSVTNLKVRVTPKSGDPVVIGTSIHKGSVAESNTDSIALSNDSNAAQSGQALYADSSNPTATLVVGDGDSSSFISTYWWAIVLLVVLALVVVAYGARKRATQP